MDDRPESFTCENFSREIKFVLPDHGMFQGPDRFVRGFFSGSQGLGDRGDLATVLDQALFKENSVFILDPEAGMAQRRVVLDGEVPGDKDAFDSQFLQKIKNKFNKGAGFFVLLLVFRGEPGAGKRGMDGALFFGAVDLEVAYQDVLFAVGLDKNKNIGCDEFCRVVKVRVLFA